VAASAEGVAKLIATKGRPAADDGRRLRDEVDSLIAVIHRTCTGGQQTTREVGVARG